jgi:hypothetical protein
MPHAMTIAHPWADADVAFGRERQLRALSLKCNGRYTCEQNFERKRDLRRCGPRSARGPEKGTDLRRQSVGDVGGHYAARAK